MKTMIPESLDCMSETWLIPIRKRLYLKAVFMMMLVMRMREGRTIPSTLALIESSSVFDILININYQIFEKYINQNCHNLSLMPWNCHDFHWFHYFHLFNLFNRFCWDIISCLNLHELLSWFHWSNLLSYFMVYPQSNLDLLLHILLLI